MKTTEFYLDQVLGLALSNKYSRWYANIVRQASYRGTSKKAAKDKLGYVEGHHILPRSFNLGGEKDRMNVIFLTAREHYLCHLLLTKMFIQEHLMLKMYKAFSKMHQIGANHGDRYINSTFFERMRKMCSEAMSGTNNPRFGKPGTFTGRSHNENSRKLISDAARNRISPLKGKTSPLKGRKIGPYLDGRGSKISASNKGKMFFTNGVVDIRLREGEEVPDGFRRGRTNGLNKSRDHAGRFKSNQAI